MIDFSRFERFKARRKTKQRQSDAADLAPVDLSAAHQHGNDEGMARLQRNAEATAAVTSRLPAVRATRRGQQQQRIDRQILHLHACMVDKLLAEPHLFAALPDQLEQARQQGLLRHSEYLFWHCAFTLFHDAAAFRSAILSQEPGPCKYRRRTRLVGILTEAERLQILQQQASLDE